MTTGKTPLTTPLDLCKCGHLKERHWLSFGQPGTCRCQIDTRPPGAGGDNLRPCPCKGYAPAEGLTS